MDSGDNQAPMSPVEAAGPSPCFITPDHADSHAENDVSVISISDESDDELTITLSDGSLPDPYPVSQEPPSTPDITSNIHVASNNGSWAAAAIITPVPDIPEPTMLPSIEPLPSPSPGKSMQQGQEVTSTSTSSPSQRCSTQSQPLQSSDARLLGVHSFQSLLSFQGQLSEAPERAQESCQTHQQQTVASPAKQQGETSAGIYTSTLVKPSPARSMVWPGVDTGVPAHAEQGNVDMLASNGQDIHFTDIHRPACPSVSVESSHCSPQCLPTTAGTIMNNAASSQINLSTQMLAKQAVTKAHFEVNPLGFESNLSPPNTRALVDSAQAAAFLKSEFRLNSQTPAKSTDVGYPHPYIMTPALNYPNTRDLACPGFTSAKQQWIDPWALTFVRGPHGSKQEEKELMWPRRLEGPPDGRCRRGKAQRGVPYFSPATTFSGKSRSSNKVFLHYPPPHSFEQMQPHQISLLHQPMSIADSSQLLKVEKGEDAGGGHIHVFGPSICIPVSSPLPPSTTVPAPVQVFKEVGTMVKKKSSPASSLYNSPYSDAIFLSHHFRPPPLLPPEVKRFSFSPPGLVGPQRSKREHFLAAGDVILEPYRGDGVGSSSLAVAGDVTRSPYASGRQARGRIQEFGYSIKHPNGSSYPAPQNCLGPGGDAMLQTSGTHEYHQPSQVGGDKDQDLRAFSIGRAAMMGLMHMPRVPAPYTNSSKRSRYSIGNGGYSEQGSQQLRSLLASYTRSSSYSEDHEDNSCRRDAHDYFRQHEEFLSDNASVVTLRAREQSVCMTHPGGVTAQTERDFSLHDAKMRLAMDATLHPSQMTQNDPSLSSAHLSSGHQQSELRGLDMLSDVSLMMGSFSASKGKKASVTSGVDQLLKASDTLTSLTDAVDRLIQPANATEAWPGYLQSSQNAKDRTRGAATENDKSSRQTMIVNSSKKTSEAALQATKGGDYKVPRTAVSAFEVTPRRGRPVKRAQSADGKASQHVPGKRGRPRKEQQQTEAIQIPCPYCNKLFSVMSNMKRHSRQMHQDVYVFNCSICRQKFSMRGTLRRHNKSHKAKLPHECRECLALFATEKELQQHRAVHVVLRFPCNECQVVFYTSEHLGDHVARYHSRGDNPTLGKDADDD